MYFEKLDNLPRIIQLVNGGASLSDCKATLYHAVCSLVFFKLQVVTIIGFQIVDQITLESLKQHFLMKKKKLSHSEAKCCFLRSFLLLYTHIYEY